MGYMPLYSVSWEQYEWPFWFTQSLPSPYPPTPHLNPTKLHKYTKFKKKKQIKEIEQYKPSRNLKSLQLQTLNNLPSESSPQMHCDSAFYDA